MLRPPVLRFVYAWFALRPLEALSRAMARVEYLVDEGEVGLPDCHPGGLATVIGAKAAAGSARREFGLAVLDTHPRAFSVLTN